MTDSTLGRSQASASFPPELAARYDLRGLLGQGGMGAVYRAFDRELGREVAIKVVLGKATEELLARFDREARALARIQHPHVMKVYDHGVVASGPYMVTEFLDGDPLTPLPPEIAPVDAMLEVAEGLQAIHEIGIIHRDLKPANVMLTRDGRAVLIDFGLAKDPDSETLTATGVMVGTLATLAPELYLGRPATPAADWYAWGASLYRLFEGVFPYDLDGIRSLSCGEQPEVRPFRKLAREGPVARTILACLAVQPSHRPRGVAELRRMLRPPAGPGPAAPAPGAAPPGGTAPMAAPPVGTAVMAAPPAEPARPEAPPPAPAPRGRGLVAAALLVLVVALGFLSGGPAGGPAPEVRPPPDPEPGGPRAAEGPMPLRLLPALEKELRSPGRAALLDPLAWEVPGAGLRACGELDRWLAARPPLPGSLDAATRARLEALDAGFRERRLPRLLAPWLAERALAESPPLPDQVTKERGILWDLPTRGGGLFGAAWQAFARSQERREELERAIEEAEVPPGLAEVSGRIHLLRLTNLREFSYGAFHSERRRTPLIRWLEPFAVEARSFLRLLGRSLAEEVATRDAATILAVRLVWTLEPLWFTRAGFQEPLALLGGFEVRPWTRLLEGELRRGQVEVRRIADLGAEASLARALQELEEAARSKGWTGPLGRTLRAQALQRWVVALRSWNRDPALLAAFREYRDEVLAMDEWVASRILETFAGAWERPRNQHLPDLAEVEALLAFLRDLPPGWGDDRLAKVTTTLTALRTRVR